ncbi:MAG TPA: hypothetical protein ENN96_00415 [Candidatus Acetothermia bacterium]|nr:hypothetical protein [Candidatus Acetothermia bacterium]
MSRATAKVGIWSASLSAVLSILWFITYQLRDVIASVPPWQDTGAYAEAFSKLRILYVYPSMLLVFTFIALMACIYLRTKNEKQVWALVALCIAILYGAMASINYNIQAASVAPSLQAGWTAGIQMLLPDNPASLFTALGNSYVYMAVAMVAASLALGASSLERWIKWLFGAQIATAIGQAGWSMFGLPEAVLIATGLVWVIGAPIAFILLALLFRQESAVRQTQSL